MKIINIGLIGYGTVGKGVYNIIYNNLNLYKKMGFKINIPYVCVNNLNKQRDFDKFTEWTQPIVTNNYNTITNNKNIDVVVEVMGGIETPLEIFNKTMKNNKYFVTANKNLIASNLEKIIDESIIRKKNIGIEACVAGGIPIIKTLKNNYLLDNEIMNLSLFDDKKIILIDNITDKSFSLIEKNISQDNCIICLFSGTLEKRSKLRNLFEKEKALGVIPCYEDNEITLRNYIKNYLKNIKGLNQEMINFIIDNSNKSRDKIKNELSKIEVYFIEKQINILELRQLLNLDENDNSQKLRDTAILGDKKLLNELISKTQINEQDNMIYIRGLLNQFVKLAEVLEINKTKKNLTQSIESLNPKIFWKDKPTILGQVNKWQIKNIKTTIDELTNAEILIKSSTDIRGSEITKKLLIDICNKASSVA